MIPTTMTDQPDARSNQPVRTARRKRDIPKGLWTKCEGCGEIIYNKTLEENLRVCPKCDYHFTLGADERIRALADPGTFQEMDADLRTKDPLKFCGPKSYVHKLEQDQLATGLK